MSGLGSINYPSFLMMLFIPLPLPYWFAVSVKSAMTSLTHLSQSIQYYNI